MDFNNMSKQQIQEYIQQQLSKMTREQKRELVKRFCNLTETLHTTVTQFMKQNTSSKFMDLLEDPEPSEEVKQQTQILIDRLKLK